MILQNGSKFGYVPQNVDANTKGLLRDEVMKAFERVLEVEDKMAASGLDIQSATGADRRDAEKRYSALLDEYETIARP